MSIDYITEEEDIVKEVRIIVSPVEYLIIATSLKQFSENHNNHSREIEVAKQMRKVIKRRGNRQ